MELARLLCMHCRSRNHSFLNSRKGERVLEIGKAEDGSTFTCCQAEGRMRSIAGILNELDMRN